MPSLFDPVTSLHGVGRERAKRLEALEIRTLYDLIAHFPRDYEDRTKILPIDRLEPGVPACFMAMVVSQPQTTRIQKGRSVTRLRVAGQTRQLDLVFFNQDYVAKLLERGESYLFYGRLSEDYRRQMVNPLFEKLEEPGVLTRRIVPIYALTAGINNKILTKLIAQALDLCLGELPEVLPRAVRERYGLCGAASAYETVHRPESFEALEGARRRLIFEEFFLFSAGLALARARRDTRPHAPYKDLDLEPFLRALPYPLTGAQRRAAGEILRDFAGEKPMNRLIEGDVGSGKTAIAAAAIYCCARNGFQSALMAPTEILAEQHFNTLAPLLAGLGIQTVLLTGSMGAAAKRSAKQAAADGTAQLAVGTHALLSGDVSFAGLDLVIADEQHRFGVAQRAALSAKANDPHLLVLSATPIPRTLSLIFYGDLDLSVVDELPPGREKVDTFLVNESYRARIHAFIRKQTGAGHQVYIVCPAVEENEETSLKSAEAWAAALRQSVFPDLSVGLLHGQMKRAEKEDVMSRFAAGAIQILVCTTVVEVGVDVPNATLMVVENAERFGLSQLHQLRGRVGRGGAKSYCVLFSNARDPETRARLKALCATNDGFQIAERDLALRGPGDFFGSRQHGLPSFKVASFSCDIDTLREAQTAAASFLKGRGADDPELAPLYERIRALFSGEDMIFN